MKEVTPSQTFARLRETPGCVLYQGFMDAVKEHGYAIQGALAQSFREWGFRDIAEGNRGRGLRPVYVLESRSEGPQLALEIRAGGKYVSVLVSAAVVDLSAAGAKFSRERQHGTAPLVPKFSGTQINEMLLRHCQKMVEKLEELKSASE